MGQPVSETGFNTIYGWAKFSPDGTISFGGVDESQRRHAVLLMNNMQPTHKIEMFNSGDNKNRTHISAPRGVHFNVGSHSDFDDGTFTIQNHRGHMVIDCQGGDFTVKARNINLRAEYSGVTKAANTTKASGKNRLAKMKAEKPGTTHGNLTLFGVNNVEIESNDQVRIFGKSQVAITATNLLRLQGTAALNIITGIAWCTSWSTRAGKPADLVNPAWMVPGTLTEAKASGKGTGVSMNKAEVAAAASAGVTAESVNRAQQTAQTIGG